jgi:hypothetical protein
MVVTVATSAEDAGGAVKDATVSAHARAARVRWWVGKIGCADAAVVTQGRHRKARPRRSLRWGGGLLRGSPRRGGLAVEKRPMMERMLWRVSAARRASSVCHSEGAVWGHAAGGGGRACDRESRGGDEHTCAARAGAEEGCPRGGELAGNRDVGEGEVGNGKADIRKVAADEGGGGNVPDC